ncbi:MAG: Veg family protein [Coriobacteriales bacterium]|nr:Veg family protein [Coriobacteriales bacterium]
MENDVPPVNRVDQIRVELSGLAGERIKVRANMGRSRIVERVGTLSQVHPALFVVEVEERRGRRARQSYQYVDVLTGTVELYDINTGERILNFSVEE